MVFRVKINGVDRTVGGGEEQTARDTPLYLDTLKVRFAMLHTLEIQTTPLTVRSDVSRTVQGECVGLRLTPNPIYRTVE